MGSKKNRALILLLTGITLCAPLEGLTQGLKTVEEGIGINLSLSAVEQFETDVGDSRFEVSRYRLMADKDLVRNRKMLLNLGISYGVSDHSFSGPPADPWSDPWKTIRNADAGLSLILPAEGNWSYFMAGTLDWSWEEGADAGEGLVHGIIASAAYAFRRDRRLGIGVGMFRGLEETKTFPYVTVSWRLKEKLSLKNPLRAGPAGPAGLELVYDATEKWQIGTGAAYRSFRFRLDDEGTTPDGIGKMTGVPAWVRASWRAGPKVNLDIHTGAILAGKASIEDSGGRKLESESYGTAPLAAINLEISL